MSNTFFHNSPDWVNTCLKDELMEELKMREQPINGLKAELLLRLYEVENNFYNYKFFSIYSIKIFF
jgi:hypothetical protein